MHARVKLNAQETVRRLYIQTPTERSALPHKAQRWREGFDAGHAQHTSKDHFHLFGHALSASALGVGPSQRDGDDGLSSPMYIWRHQRWHGIHVVEAARQRLTPNQPLRETAGL